MWRHEICIFPQWKVVEHYMDGGLSQAKHFKGKYFTTLNLNVLGGGGGGNKPGGGVDINNDKTTPFG